MIIVSSSIVSDVVAFDTLAFEFSESLHNLVELILILLDLSFILFNLNLVIFFAIILREKFVDLLFQRWGL